MCLQVLKYVYVKKKGGEREERWILISLIKTQKLKKPARETDLKLTGHRQRASPLAFLLLEDWKPFFQKED